MSWFPGAMYCDAPVWRASQGRHWRTHPLRSPTAAVMCATAQVPSCARVAVDAYEKSCSKEVRPHEGVGHATLSWLRN